MNRRQFLTGSICGAASVAVTASGASLLTSCAGAAVDDELAALKAQMGKSDAAAAPSTSVDDELDALKSQLGK